MNTIACNELLRPYEELLATGRRRFASRLDEVIRTISSSLDIARWFLLRYTSLSVPMTQPVETWIRRAGNRCVEMGAGSVGATLRLHAKHEANHDKMLVADTRWQAAHWKEHGIDVNAAELLSHPPLEPTRRYVDLHEQTIDSAEPWGQIAIEYEIERISNHNIPSLLAALTHMLGEEILGGLSSLREHVELDVGHSELNSRVLATMLDDRPNALAGLVAKGAEALEIYGGFLIDCLAIAQRDAHSSEIPRTSG